AAHRRDALAAQAEQLAGLGAFRNLQLDPAIQGRHFQLAAERRVGEADRDLAVQMLAVTLEDRVLADIDHHVEVAGRPTEGPRLALAGQADAVAAVDAGRHLDRQGLVFLDAPLTLAGATGIGDHLAAAVAARAGLLHREEALLHADLADAATGTAGDRRGALLGTGAVTGLAAHQGRHAD